MKGKMKWGPAGSLRLYLPKDATSASSPWLTILNDELPTPKNTPAPITKLNNKSIIFSLWNTKF
jgi:hypothetical protein